MTRTFTRFLRSVAAVLVLTLSLGACAQGGMGGGMMGGPMGPGGQQQGGFLGMGTKEGFGTLLGGAAGGLLGSRFGSGTGKLIATAGGTLFGAFLGNSIGSSLDRADQAAHQQAAMQAFNQAPVGGSTSWRNPQNGNQGQIQITNSFNQPMSNGMGGTINTECREFQQTIVVGGKAEQGVGRACRSADGSWRIQNG